MIRIFGVSQLIFGSAKICIREPTFIGDFEGVVAGFAAWTEGESEETKLK